ncbi:MAG: mucoidy inhibitor MuiA family protein [Thermoflexibacter sp.]|nr:mucoidy inhibitor MuiA family protein [Thermoflexibacter sp.]
MKHILLIIKLLIFSNFIFAGETPKNVESKLEKVTVFLNGATLSRTASTSLVSGNTQLKFTNLSPHINPSSIQVKGEGNFTILSVVHQVNYLQPLTKGDEIPILEARKQELNDKLDLQKSMREVYQKEEEMLMSNKAIGGSDAGVKIAELKEATEFYRTRLIDIKTKLLEVANVMQKLNEEINKIESQLISLNSERKPAASEIIVTLTAKAPTNARFTIAYFVSDAHWTPTYDLRVKDVASPISLIYRANVSQLSGEDWNNVKLTLSTGDPSQSGTKPTLNPWYLGFYNPYSYQPQSKTRVQNYAYKNNFYGIIIDNTLKGRVIDAESGMALPGVNVVLKGTTIGTITDVNGNYSIDLEQNRKIITFSFVGYLSQEINIQNYADVQIAMLPDTRALQEVVVTGYGEQKKGLFGRREKREEDLEEATPIEVTQSENQLDVTFEIEQPYTVPTDGKEYGVEMKNYELNAQYEYYATPKLDATAFLVAYVTGWEEFNLMQGEANLFFEGEYLGKTNLNVNSNNDTLDISLGRDRNITVTRTKLKNFTNRQWIGSNKTESRGFEINVKNKKKQAINIVIEDQVPVSTNKEIEIEVQEVSSADWDKEKGKLTWKFKLGSGDNKKMTLKYAVKYPKNQVVVLE